MRVKVFDYGFDEGACRNYVKYRVSGLDPESIAKLQKRLEEDTEIEGDDMIITVYYEREYYPFGSEEARIRMEDFIAREEIEMTVFLTSVLQD